MSARHPRGTLWVRRAFHPHTRSSSDQGVALIMVIAIGFVMTLFATAVVTYAVGSMRPARHDQDFQAALGAADAGIDDYLYRVNNSSNYYTYSTTVGSCSSSSAPANPDPNNAAMSGFTAVPGGSSGATFRYNVDVSQYCVNGTIKVASTGKVNGVTRTVQATIGHNSFLNYMYFTDVEDADPANTAAYPNQSIFTGNALYNPPVDDNISAVCGRRYWSPSSDGNLSAPRPDDITNSPGCSTINFGGGDTLNGPVHTNDAMLVCGSVTFNGPVYTAWTGAGGKHWRSNPNCSGNNPVFNGNNGLSPCNGGVGTATDACYEAAMTLPSSNSQLKLETDPTVTNPPGCLYTGPTQITLNSNGTMNVTSPDTTSSNPGCTPGNGLAIPTDGVIYVQNVPTGSPSVACSTWNGVRLSGTQVVSSGGTKSYQNPLGYPISNDITPYGCTDGDAFVSGTLKGQLTIAAEHDINVTGNLTYANGTTGSDVLGLIANNYVQIYHPVQCTGFNGSGVCNSFANLGGSLSNPQVYAAMLALTHSFRAQNYNYGASLGNLNMTGAIAMEYRGPVGIIGSSGYVKSYHYDSRLQFVAPPHFLSPVQAAFHATASSEQPRNY